MAGASFAVTNFQGGEWSQWAQGRFDRPDYRTALNVCLNMLPTEQGALVRRPGTQNGGATRGNSPGRVIAWDFRQSTPYVVEFTAGKLRFWSFTNGFGQPTTTTIGPTLATTNDDAAISSISTASPAVVTITTSRSWATGDSVKFGSLGASCPLLQNNVFRITRLTGLTFSLQNEVGINIDGSTLGVGSLAAAATMQHVQEINTPYSGTTWQLVRLVQSELQAVLLHPAIPPQVVTVTPATSPNNFAVFALVQAVFTDGPYLDSPTNGALLSPSVTSGSTTLTLTFAAWSATVAYALNAFVNNAGTNYQSLIDANLNNSPPTSPSAWVAVSAGKAVGPNGFVGTDVGRLIRLQDSTGNWTWGKIVSIANQIPPAAFTKFGNMVNYGGLAGAFNGTTNQSFAAGAGAIFSTDPTGGAYVGLNFGASPQKIDHATYYPSNNLGIVFASYTLTQNASLYQAQFDPGSLGVIGYAGRVSGAGGGWVVGDTVIGNSSGATAIIQITNFAINGNITVSNVTGIFQSGETIRGNASGAHATCVAFQQPPTLIWVFQNTTATNFTSQTGINSSFVSLRARPPGPGPGSATDGTLLGFVSPASGSFIIPSSDTATLWQFVWFDIETNNIQDQLPGTIDQRNTTPLVFGAQAYLITYSLVSIDIENYCAQAQFFNPPGNSSGNGIVVELFGGTLANLSNISVWRLGTYSNTTGFPACGTYHENRLWLAGAVSNRVDASQSGNIFGFAPTNGASSQVLDSSAINATFSGPDVNTLFWLMPDELGIIVGTQAGDWVIRATTAGLPLTPSTMQAHRFSKMGCANIEPRRADHTIVMVQRWGRKIMELFADVFSQKLGAQNITWNARHLTKPGIAEIAYQQELAPIVWSRNMDGSIFGITYKRESNVSSNPPNFAGHHRHVLGSGRLIESITVGSSVDGLTDTLVMVTNDPSTNIRHVEFLTSIFEEANDEPNAWFLDDADNPTSVVPGVTSCVLNGFSRLNSKLVTVFCGGIDCGDWTVVNGSITMTYGDGISIGTGNGLFTQLFANQNIATFVVGFTYNSDFQIVRPMTPQESGARNGPALGKRRRVMQFGALLETTVAISMGTSFTKLNPALFKATPTAGTPLATGVPFNGVYWDTLTDEWSFDGMICGRISRPYSANIVALEGFIETSDK
jgi:hypothetical protein